MDSCDSSGEKLCDMQERLEIPAFSLEEHDVDIDQADLKKHLTLTEEDERLW